MILVMIFILLLCCVSLLWYLCLVRIFCGVFFWFVFFLFFGIGGVLLFFWGFMEVGLMGILKIVVFLLSCVVIIKYCLSFLYFDLRLFLVWILLNWRMYFMLDFVKICILLFDDRILNLFLVDCGKNFCMINEVWVFWLLILWMSFFCWVRFEFNLFGLCLMFIIFSWLSVLFIWFKVVRFKCLFGCSICFLGVVWLL